MYNLLESRCKSSANFREFLSYMISERNHINGMPEQEKTDFVYHYQKLPEYFEQYMNKYETDILKATVSIQLGIDRLQKAGK